MVSDYIAAAIGLGMQLMMMITMVMIFTMVVITMVIMMMIIIISLISKKDHTAQIISEILFDKRPPGLFLN